jgi:DNA-binding NarL/FixJ family response regulator
MQVLHEMEPNLVVLPSLLLADDNPALLETLVEMLEPAYRVAAALGSGASVLEEVAALCPDLVILDISLGDLTGFDVARRLREVGCSAKIIFLTVHEDIDFVNAAFDLGASGYVFKSRITADLTKAIDIVFNGGQFTSVKTTRLQ